MTDPSTNNDLIIAWHGVDGDTLGEEQPFELGARPLGPKGDRLAQRLIRHIRDWDTQGRPGTAGLQVSAYPRHTGHVAIADADSIIEKRYTRLALTWAP